MMIPYVQNIAISLIEKITNENKTYELSNNNSVSRITDFYTYLHFNVKEKVEVIAADIFVLSLNSGILYIDINPNREFIPIILHFNLTPMLAKENKLLRTEMQANYFESFSDWHSKKYHYLPFETLSTKGKDELFKAFFINAISQVDCFFDTEGCIMEKQNLSFSQIKKDFFEKVSNESKMNEFENENPKFKKQRTQIEIQATAEIQAKIDQLLTHFKELTTKVC